MEQVLYGVEGSTSGRERRWGNDMGGWLYYKYCACMYINFKNDTCWNCSRNGSWGGERNMVEGVNSSMIYLKHYKNFCKSHNVPPIQQSNQKKRSHLKKQL
jgi:hypothetical protein